VEERPAQAAHASLSPGAPDSLPEEVRLLSKAEQQLSAGRADDALRTLGEHERRFPGGVLAEERLAARVQALCALGRVTEARADLARLARAYPQSPHLDRARKFCGVDTP
jgi:outer membrane protein assembly factor BamD (BamD/ComL family)